MTDRMSRSLTDKVVLLTGASSGLGAEMSLALLGAGAKVVLCARRLDRVKELVAQNENALAVRCDVTDEDDRRGLIMSALERFGRIDGLVNNAGISNVSVATRERVEDFRNQLEVNLVAPFALSQLAVAEMRRVGEGSIVNVASVLGLRSINDMPEAGYVASKAGLIGLTRELASQWGRHGVRVNALAPGFFPSEMTDGLFDSDENAPDWLVEGTPLGRGGRRGELNDSLIFLLSDSSSYVSGHTLSVDGGMATR
jgi:NAD(P)-dependent dehydrogenase (short-subunit alcohol dehydrogenase family)